MWWSFRKLILGMPFCCCPCAINEITCQEMTSLVDKLRPDVRLLGAERYCSTPPGVRQH